ncbi:PREDICTED: uncharacterized protein LOC108559122 [Nicrophorus vespilloides]|uniref:Uncharacterized protein LOC108559122 n=1 Tax=Nicrophorus vespilloides TaxID=110193 RepID=A0ABM1MB06_NICVS|nr:PREDICTED: uncharacterized protein LOC108559122 [Nicrophorus vespilloides]
MDANCMIMTKGCIVITKPYKTAKAKYQLQKPPMPDLKGNIDICKELTTKKRKSAQLLSSLGFKCPSEAKSLCATNPQKLDISKYKKQLHMAAGKSNLKIDIQHDNGKSCVDIEFEIYK